MIKNPNKQTKKFSTRAIIKGLSQLHQMACDHNLITHHKNQRLKKNQKTFFSHKRLKKKLRVICQHMCTSGAWNVKFLFADWSRRWCDRWQKLWGEDGLCVFSHNALKLCCDFSQSLWQQLLCQAVGQHTRNKRQLYSGYWHINLYLGPYLLSAEVKTASSGCMAA